MTGSVYGAELQPFASGDAWTYQQHRDEPNKLASLNEIRFSIISKKKTGDSVLGWAKAITKDNQIIWQPIGVLFSAICLRDFIGRTDLNLASSCKDGLNIGAEWKSITDSPEIKEQLKFKAIGEESLVVAAGSFSTLKIVGIGTISTPNESAQDVTVTYWFSPEAKAMVRSIQEYRLVSGVRVLTITDELTEVKVQAYTHQCTSPNDVTQMLKAASSDIRSAKNANEVEFSTFKADMNQKGAQLDWDENQKSEVFGKIKKIEQFIFFEAKKNQLMSEILSRKELITASAIEKDPVGTCNQLQTIQNIFRNVDLVRSEQRDFMRGYLLNIKK